MIELDKSRLGGLKHASPEVRDRLARAALLANARLHGPAIGISDDAPENKFAEVRVGGKVVATLYNGGSSVMSNDAFARIGHLNEPSIVGPDLAKWRAETYARLLGGTVEIATTAMRQEDWKPRTETTPTYSQEELDRAFEFTQRLAEHRRATFSAKLASLAGTADLRV